MSWGCRKNVVWMLLALAALTIIIRARIVESCIEEERLALLDLNSYFRSHYDPKYAQNFRGLDYGAEDRYNCCSWRRVHCNPTTQHIIKLDLSYILSYDQKAWVFNVTMLQPFRQLMSLDLSSDSIGGFVEKQGLCELKNLSELHLTENSFNDVLPSCLQNVASLQIVDLSFNQMNGRFHDIIPSNLASLRYLDLSHNNLTGELLPNVFQNLTSLEQLDLSDNHFEGKLSLNSFANHSKLQFLDLSRNQLQVQTEDSSWRPTFQLQHLNLQGCSLNQPDGTVPKFLSQQHNLSFINLSDNNLVGSLPSFLLSNNSMPRDLALENENLDTLPLYSGHSLTTLAISGNNFYGELPENIGFIFPQLNVLNVSRCHFQGSIPTSIAHMSQLWVLDLSYNNFSGELPRQLLSDLTQLQALWLNNNNLQGEIIPENMNLTSLVDLKLSNNHFGGTIKDALGRSLQLASLDVSNNMVTGSLPSWIGNFSKFYMLSFSNNAIQGQIPREICKLQDLDYLDLSGNNFIGSIPSCSNFSELSAMLLRQNKLTGGIPYALSSVSSLSALDLRDNQLSGGIPLWINKLQSLQILLLGGNNFRGHVPHQLCQLRDLNLLDLSHNQLSGSILTCFGNMSFGFKPIINQTPKLEVYLGSLDVGFSFGLEEIVELLVKHLNLPYVGTDLEHMSALDLSNNKFSGVIPPELGDLQYLHSINLSQNCLSGSIPSNLSNLKQMESLDLSYNHLSGMIPNQLAELNFLGTFNVSYNNLTGRTPEAGQFRTFDESSYFGNPGLCVTLVNESCNPLPPNAPPPSVSSTSEEDGDDDEGGGGLDMEDFLWSFGVTSFVAFMATIAVLGINPRWREALFDFVEWHLLWWLL